MSELQKETALAGALYISLVFSMSVGFYDYLYDAQSKTARFDWSTRVCDLSTDVRMTQ